MAEPVIEVIRLDSWRDERWDDDVPSRAGWQVRCSEHGIVRSARSRSKDWAYAAQDSAKAMATRHRQKHGIEPRRRYSFTRDQLIDVISRLEAYPATLESGRVVIMAESMADAIIEGLEDSRG